METIFFSSFFCVEVFLVHSFCDGFFTTYRYGIHVVSLLVVLVCMYIACMYRYYVVVVCFFLFVMLALKRVRNDGIKYYEGVRRGTWK